MKATFENSVSVLVRAYMNDTLQKMSCAACACGNLVADANGYTFNKRLYSISSESLMWDQSEPLVNYAWPTWRRSVRNECTANNENESRLQAESTGYTNSELVVIEDAFMRGNDSTDDGNFTALLAVVDVLAEIHGVDLSVKESAVLQFAEIHATK